MMSAWYNLGRSRGSTAWILRNTNMADVLRTVHRAQTQRPSRLCPDPFRSNVLPLSRDLESGWNTWAFFGPKHPQIARLTERSSLLHENQSTSTPTLQHGHQPPSQSDSLESLGKMKFLELGCIDIPI